MKTNKQIRLKPTPKPTFHIFRFLILFALLTGGFYTYVGITSPGGKTYSPFLDHYLNITAWLTWLLAKAALTILKLSGFIVYQHAPNNVTIAGSPGVTILWACLGLGVMSFWSAFVIAHKATWQFRLKWCLIGIALITVLNIARIVLIALANHYHWRVITSLEPHETFNIASYILLFAIIGWFIRRYKQYEYDVASHSTAENNIISSVISG
jgi:exosortase/archaeosortase family protein